MKNFLLKLLIFFLICAALDVAVGYASTSLQRSSKGGLTHKDEFIKNIMNADVVIMGSSRASHHYVSNLLADSLGCSVYNAGMDGKGIIMNYGVLLEITRRYDPKTIIYELTPSFDWEMGDNEKYLAHLRHAYGITGIDSIFWNVNLNERIKMLSNSYRANSLVPHLIYDNIVAQNDTLNGYIPLWGVYKPMTEGKESSDIGTDDVNNLDPLKAEYLKKFINLCYGRNIELIFAISPTINYSQDNFKIGKELAKENNLRIIDYNEMNTSFSDEKLYQDKSHLNNNGAILYSKEVLKKINN